MCSLLKHSRVYLLSYVWNLSLILHSISLRQPAFSLRLCFPHRPQQICLLYCHQNEFPKMPMWFNDFLNCFPFKRKGGSFWYDIQGFSKLGSNPPSPSHVLMISLGYHIPYSSESISHPPNTQMLLHLFQGLANCGQSHESFPLDFDCNYYMIANSQLYRIMLNCCRFIHPLALYANPFKLHFSSLYYQTITFLSICGRKCYVICFLILELSFEILI